MGFGKGRQGQRFKRENAESATVLPETVQVDPEKLLAELRTIPRCGHGFKRCHEDRHRSYGRKGATT